MAYAFALPVLPGKAEAAKQFVAEVLGPRLPGARCRRVREDSQAMAAVRKQPG